MPWVKNCQLNLPLLVLIFCLQQSIWAQEQFRHHAVTPEQGLSQGVVNCILQDNHGFMWFGTQDGLNRYDGNSVTIFKTNPLDSNSLATNDINCLLEDDHKILWIGTDGGLSALNLYTGKFKNYLHVNSFHPDKNNIRTLYQDKEGTIWLGTEFNCLCKLNTETGKFITYQLELKDTASSTFDYVSSITEDALGKLWIGSFGGGLYSFDKKNGKYENYYQYADGHSVMGYVNNISTVYYQKENNELLVGTKGRGVEGFALTTKKFKSYYNPDLDTLYTREPKMIFSITKDNSGNIWVAGNNGEGLYRFEEAERVYISYKRSRQANSTDFNQDFCNYLYVSPDNILWVGTNNGVSYYIPEKKNFIIYKDTTNPAANVVMSSARDAGNKIWIGTNGSGLRTYDEITHAYSQNQRLAKAINNISIISLFIDKADNLWIGTWGSGVKIYNLLTEKITSIDSINIAIAKTSVTSITQDHTGKIWIGTYDKGVFVYDEKNTNIARITVNNGLSDNRVYGFLEDAEQNMWICTDGGGFNCYAPDGKITFIKK